MKSYYALSWKELISQKITSILILIAIILSTMMITVIGQSIGILNAMRVQQASTLNGNRYATLHQVNEEQANKLLSDSRLSYAAKIISLGVSDIPESNISIILREYEGNALSAYESISQLESGHLPENSGEIALPQDVLSMLGFKGKIGDTISLNIHISLLKDTEQPYSYSSNFILTGILKPNYIAYVSGSSIGIVGSGTGKLILPEKYFHYSIDIRVKDHKSFQSTIDDLSKTYSIPDYCVQYNDTMLSLLGIKYNVENKSDNFNGFSFMTMASVMIGVLVLLAAGLVIYNILKISVTKKIKSYGTLRAIGTERGKLYTIVSFQILILCGISIPIGIILGMLSSKGITIAAATFFSPETFMATSQSEVTELITKNSSSKILPLIISIFITLIFSFFAALPAARYAGNVSPIIAMSGITTNIKRRNRGKKIIHNFEAFYAHMNMNRNKGRSIITILSLIMSITVFVALQSFSDLLDSSSSVKEMHIGDYSITNEITGFLPESVEHLKTLLGAKYMHTLKYKLYLQDESGNIPEIKTSFTLQPGETLQIVGIDEERIRKLMPSISDEDMKSLKNGTSCLIKNPIPISSANVSLKNTSIKTGDSIIVNEIPLIVISEVNNSITLDNDGFTNGIQIIVFDTVYNRITGQHNYTEIYPSLFDKANRKNSEEVIKSFCNENGGKWISYENTDKQLKESYEQIHMLAWGLIILIGVIGILNIINTVYTNIHTRISEIGIQRAIGMSNISLYKTLLWEAAYYAIIASIVGSILGYLCTIFISAAATDKIQLTSIPIVSIGKAVIFSISACLIATLIPLIKITKMDIVESIEIVE